jgi:quinohemoprotein ethanol dehydrogenase
VDKEFKIDPALADKGQRLYGACSGCHGPGMVAMGMAPDLRASPIPLNIESFRQVVTQGVKANMGMPSFNEELMEDDLLALMHFIRKRAHDDADTSSGERVGH